MSASIVAKSLCAGYGNLGVISHVDFGLQPGGLMVLIGTNGSGKSTLLKTLAGIIAPVDGEVLVLGELPGSSPENVAYLPQHPKTSGVLPLRAKDIVAMGRFARQGLLGRSTAIDSEAVERAMQRTGVDAIANRSLAEMSGGQQQRTHLAQVLAREADVLLIDEPTAGLDANGREAVKQILREERSRGCAVVLATHDLEDAEDADLVMLLAHRVVAVGTPSQVLTDANLRACFGFTDRH